MLNEVLNQPLQNKVFYVEISWGTIHGSVMDTSKSIIATDEESATKRLVDFVTAKPDFGKIWKTRTTLYSDINAEEFSEDDLEDEDDRIFSATDIYDAMDAAIKEALKGDQGTDPGSYSIFIDDYIRNLEGS